MKNEKRFGAVVVGIAAIIGLVLTGGACSSVSTAGNTSAAAVHPVNAPTPTVQEVIDAKKREQQAQAAQLKRDPYAGLGYNDRMMTEGEDERKKGAAMSDPGNVTDHIRQIQQFTTGRGQGKWDNLECVRYRVAANGVRVCDSIGVSK